MSAAELAEMAVDARLTMTDAERAAKHDEHNNGWHIDQPDALCGTCEYWGTVPAWAQGATGEAARRNLTERNETERSVLAGADWSAFAHA